MADATLPEGGRYLFQWSLPLMPGHNREKNALPPDLLEEMARWAMRTTTNPHGKVILDLCAGFQSWAPVAAALGCDYVAVDVLGKRA